MATTEPWITLGRSFDRCLATMNDETLERYVAVSDGDVVGFVLLSMRGTFTGSAATDLFSQVAWQFGEFVAIIAGALWYLTVLTLTPDSPTSRPEMP